MSKQWTNWYAFLSKSFPNCKQLRKVSSLTSPPKGTSVWRATDFDGKLLPKWEESWSTRRETHVPWAGFDPMHLWKHWCTAAGITHSATDCKQQTPPFIILMVTEYNTIWYAYVYAYVYANISEYFSSQQKSDKSILHYISSFLKFHF